jgi:hypothetical protein
MALSRGLIQETLYVNSGTNAAVPGGLFRCYPELRY